MGRRILRRHIWGYSVCLCPIKGTPGLKELKESHKENLIFALVKTKPQISCEVVAQLIRVFVPARQVELFLYFFKPKFQPASHMSRLMRKPTICICENKGADQLRGNREADQRLCFRYADSTLPLLLKSEISSF